MFLATSLKFLDDFVIFDAFKFVAMLSSSVLEANGHLEVLLLVTISIDGQSISMNL